MLFSKPLLLLLDPAEEFPPVWWDFLRVEYDLHRLRQARELRRAAELLPPAAVVFCAMESRADVLERSLDETQALATELPVILVMGSKLQAAQRTRILNCPFLGHVELETPVAELSAIIKRAVRQGRLLLERRYLRDLFLEEVALELQGLLPLMEHEVKLAASSEEGVLIGGEAGSGRRQLARLIHLRSPRSSGAFVSFNPDGLTASECRQRLFGRGENPAGGQRGLIELAESGSLLIEEIELLPQAVQEELSHTLLNGSSSAIEGRTPTVRLLGTCKTQRLEALRDNNGNDPLGRIGGLRLHIPEMAERRSNVLSLLQSCVDRSAHRYGKGPRRIAPATQALLQRYAWPGGLTEIQRVAELAVLRSRGELLGEEDFWVFGLDVATLPVDYKKAKRSAERSFKRAFFTRLLKRYDGKVTDAAAACGLPRPSLSTMLKQVGIRAADFKPFRKAKAATR